MIIDDKGVLAGSWYKASPNKYDRPLKPTRIVMHFTAGGEGAADWLCRPEAQASAHVVVERDGSIKQIVPFTKPAWHATVANGNSIGIEIANWGPVDKAAGAWLTWTKRKLPDSAVEVAKHKNQAKPRGWEKYPEIQLAAVANLVRALIAKYPTIKAIIGHDDVDPRNKVDPGPLFPMDYFRSLLTAKPSVAKSKTVAATAIGTATTTAAGQFAEPAAQSFVDMAKGLMPDAMAAAVTPGFVKWVLIALAVSPLLYVGIRYASKVWSGEAVSS